MKKCLSAVLGVAGVLTLAAQSQAALVLNDSDISSNHYVYNLTKTEMDTTQFWNDWYGSNNVYVNYESTNTSITAYSWNAESMYVTYLFDFSTTGYRPTSANITSSISFFTLGIKFSSKVSADGVVWYDLDPASAGSRVTTLTVTAATVNATEFPDQLYYKIEIKTDDGSAFPWIAAQWNRVSSDSDPATFTADFTVVPVPEVASLGLLGVGGMLMAARRKR